MKLIINMTVNRNGDKLTSNCKIMKIFTVSRKSHHSIETLSIAGPCCQSPEGFLEFLPVSFDSYKDFKQFGRLEFRKQISFCSRFLI